MQTDTCQHLEGFIITKGRHLCQGVKKSGGFHRNIFIYIQGSSSSAYNEVINLGYDKNTLEARLKLNFHDYKAFLLLAVEHMPWI